VGDRDDRPAAVTGTARRRVAVVQAAAVAFDAAAGMAALREYVRAAAADGCDVTVFPEAYLGGYPRGLSFGTTVGARTPGGREWFRRYHAGAVDIPGPITEELASIAAESGVFIVVGVIERAGGTLFCTVVFADPQDGIVSARRKLMPTGSERLIWGQGNLAQSPVVRTRVGAIGAVICWENYMPLFRTYAYSEGAQLWCAPTADARQTWEITMRHIAVEGRCFVASANQFTLRSDYPDDYPLDVPPDTVLCDGASMIVDPSGAVLAGPARSGPAVLVADLDFDDNIRGSFDFDPVGHYSRPDLFTLLVRTESDQLVRKAARPRDFPPPTQS
jgi:nitrilase